MQNQGLGTWVRRRRVKSRDRTAIRTAEGALTYGELSLWVERLAHGLRRRGIGSGDRVAYLGGNHPAFLETLFAAGVLGAVFVPLNTRLAPQELRYALSDSGAEILVHAGTMRQLAQQGAEGTAVRHMVEVEGSAESSSLSSLTGSDAEGHGAEEEIDVAVSLDDPAMILYTSGTTGRPKGAVLTHGNMTWNAVNVLTDYDISSRDIALQISPMFHVASLGMGVLPMILKGATVILQDRFEPAEVLRTIEAHRVTGLSGVPTTFQMLAEHTDWDDTDLSSLHHLTCGGSAVPLRVMEAYEARGLAFSGGYGLTETSPGATSVPADRSREKLGSSGLAHFFTDVRIADPLGGQLSTGEVGEIQISGPNVVPGYWNAPEATAEAFTEDGWLRSGDLGSLDDEGFLYVTGRSKDMIISGGENIYPAEVEQIIMELPQIEAVAVVGTPDDRWGEVPKAVVVLKEGAACSLELLRDHLDGRVARYKLPRHYQERAELPRTASGKVRKNELKG